MARQKHLENFGLRSHGFTPDGELRRLAESDPVIGQLVERVGPYRLRLVESPWETLVASIVYQQISGSAAERVFLRLKSAHPALVRYPAHILSLPIGSLLSLGIPRHKETAIRNLAEAVGEGRIEFNHLARSNDDTIISALTDCAGVGPWTARMFLVFHLGRPNVLLSSDLGLRRAVARQYELAETPSAKEVEGVAENWQPVRTLATWYLWKSLPGFPEPGFPVASTTPA